MEVEGQVQVSVSKVGAGDAALPGDPSTKVQKDKPNQSRDAFDLQLSTLV